MRLSDIMSAMRLSSYAEVGLLLFFAAFIAIAVQVFRAGKSEEWQAARRLPLDSSSGDPASGDPSSVDAPSARPRTGAEASLRESHRS